MQFGALKSEVNQPSVRSRDWGDVMQSPNTTKKLIYWILNQLQVQDWLFIHDRLGGVATIMVWIIYFIVCDYRANYEDNAGEIKNFSNTFYTIWLQLVKLKISLRGSLLWCPWQQRWVWYQEIKDMLSVFTVTGSLLLGSLKRENPPVSYNVQICKALYEWGIYE